MSIKATSLLGNSQRLDGGAMFGNAPKALWRRWVTPDDENRIPLACRCLLIEIDNKRILLETGVGAFFEPKLKERYGVVESEHVLLNALSGIGIAPDDIDFVILSHLHFDHAGGLLNPYVEGKPLSLAFKNARIITSKTAFERAENPHPRDKASFIPELLALLSSEQLILIEDEPQITPLPSVFSFTYSHGHTPGMLITTIKGQNTNIVFGADLVPGAPWVHLPITMGYDRFPEMLIEEKEALLKTIVDEKSYLFFTHDPQIACAQVEQNAAGKYIPHDAKETLSQWLL